MSNIVHKVKDALNPDHPAGSTTTHSPYNRENAPPGYTTVDTYDTAGGRAGPHRSGLANKLDPRVDSDRDGSYTVGTGTTATNVGGYGSQHGSTNYGPHKSNVANKLDPRVDSDQDGSYKVGTGGYSGGGYNDNAATGSTNYGPHTSNIANKLDPRVDPDRDHRANPTSTLRTTGTDRGYKYNTSRGGGYTTGPTNYGPYSLNTANKLDPVIDSDKGHRANPSTSVGNTGTAEYPRTTASGIHDTPGPAPHTAGPHRSDLLNKLDPRVDSDLDGSRTYGGNKTFSDNTTGPSGTTGTTERYA